MSENKVSAILDTFYVTHGSCSAGCDWWAYFNSLTGECRRSAPVAGEQRITMLGMRSPSRVSGAGHVMTLRDHHCGEFKDDFDWSTLPPHYLRRIGRAAAETSRAKGGSET